MNHKFISMIQNENDNAYIRLSIKEMCEKIGFDTSSTESVLLILTELLTNVKKHAGGNGKVTAEVINSGSRSTGISIIVEDYGPGIDNLDESIKDGFSTSGSLGLGLGALYRLGDEVTINTKTENNDESGTKIEVKKYIWSKDNSVETVDNSTNTISYRRWMVNGYTVRKEGSRYNGDRYFWIEDDLTIMIAIIDGLGHGYSASVASSKAIEIIKRFQNNQLESIVRKVHQALASSVGCQLLIMRINKNQKEAEYYGVGNIRGYLITPTSSRALTTKEGIIGRSLPSFYFEKITIPFPAVIVLHTDGISRVWLSKIREGKKKGFFPLEIEDQFKSDFRKVNDDSTYVVVKNY